MKKLITGAIAGTVGIALLVGGAGTFALWSSQAQVTSTNIQAGHMTLEAVAGGKWQEISSTNVATDLPSGYKIIPGKTVQFTQDLAITAVGNDLKADLTYGDLTKSTSDTLSTYMKNVAVVVSSSDANVVPSTVNGKTVLSVNAPGTYTVKVAVKATFDPAVTGQQGADLTYSLNTLGFTLAQK